jgi:hypothetical protein
MKLHMSSFGEIEVDGERFAYDLVIERGKLRKREKKPSKAFREGYGPIPFGTLIALSWAGKYFSGVPIKRHQK